MAKYKIIVIAHSLKNNKIGKFGEVVDESQLLLPPNQLKGFVELVEEKDKSEEEIKEIKVEVSEVKKDDLEPKKESKSKSKAKDK